MGQIWIATQKKGLATLTGISINVYPGTWIEFPQRAPHFYAYMLDVPGTNLGKFILYLDKEVIYVKEYYFLTPSCTRSCFRICIGRIVGNGVFALPRRRRPGTHRTGDWVGSMAGLDGCRKSRPPPGFDPRTFQPIASRYTDWAIPADELL
jgi:hypothetical protein